MSQIHKVILLNKPIKIFGFTLFQWIFVGLSVVSAAIIAGKCPTDIKWHNIPIGFIVAIVIVTVTIMLITATELKPMQWWRNSLIYRLGLTPTVFLPRPEPAPLYPDPTIIDAKKKEDDFYLGS